MSIPQQPRAVVTGGASGLGRAFCHALAARGGKVLIADRDLAGAEETAAQVAAKGGQARVVGCDVSKPEDVANLAIVAKQHFGGTDLVINNAGVAVAGPVGDVPLRDWEWIIGINLYGVIYGCHTFAPIFKAQGSGHILNVASAAGLLSAPDMGPYNVTKAGVVALSETLAGELSQHKVGITVLCPTFFRTKIMDSSRSGATGDKLNGFVGQLMDRSKIQADDVARIALESCDRNQFYVVPMPDGQWAWRLKRMAPESYYRRIMPRVMKYMQKNGG